jgi:hypothetical protein
MRQVRDNIVGNVFNLFGFKHVFEEQSDREVCKLSRVDVDTCKVCDAAKRLFCPQRANILVIAGIEPF